MPSALSVRDTKGLTPSVSSAATPALDIKALTNELFMARMEGPKGREALFALEPRLTAALLASTGDARLELSETFQRLIAPAVDRSNWADRVGFFAERLETVATNANAIDTARAELGKLTRPEDQPLARTLRSAIKDGGIAVADWSSIDKKFAEAIKGRDQAGRHRLAEQVDAILAPLMKMKDSNVDGLSERLSRQVSTADAVDAARARLEKFSGPEPVTKALKSAVGVASGGGSIADAFATAIKGLGKDDRHELARQMTYVLQPIDPDIGRNSHANTLARMTTQADQAEVARAELEKLTGPGTQGLATALKTALKDNTIDAAEKASIEAEFEKAMRSTSPDARGELGQSVKRILLPMIDRESLYAPANDLGALVSSRTAQEESAARVRVELGKPGTAAERGLFERLDRGLEQGSFGVDMQAELLTQFANAMPGRSSAERQELAGRIRGSLAPLIDLGVPVAAGLAADVDAVAARTDLADYAQKRADSLWS